MMLANKHTSTSIPYSRGSIEVIILVGFVTFYVVLPLWAMREGVVHAVTRGSTALLVCLILPTALAAQGLPPQQAGLLGLLVGEVVYILFPSRSRHIPAPVRRRVIARDLKGKNWDSRKHHIDHRWPFSLREAARKTIAS